MPGHHPIGDAIQAAIGSTELQLLATLVALSLLVVVGVGVRAVGPRLKTHIDSGIVESLQAGFMTLFTATVSLFLILVWRAGWLVERGFEEVNPSSQQLIAVALSVLIFVAAYVLTRMTKNSIRRLSEEQGAITDHQQEVGHHIVQLCVFGLALLVVLGIWNVNPGDLLLGAGAATVVFGLAARQTLGAVLAGFVVLFSRPFDLGDWVIIGDEEGIVTDISIVNTRIRTFNDEYVMIPNDIVTDTEIRNRSRKGRLRLETDVGVDYRTDVQHAMHVAAEAMGDTDTPMERPDPNVVVSEFGGSSVVLKLRYYINNPSARKMWDARTEVITAVKQAFAVEGIKIPFPQRELSGRPEAGGLAVSGMSASGDDVQGEKSGGSTDAEETTATDRVERESAATGDGAKQTATEPRNEMAESERTDAVGDEENRNVKGDPAEES